MKGTFSSDLQRGNCSSVARIKRRVYKPIRVDSYPVKPLNSLGIKTGRARFCYRHCKKQYMSGELTVAAFHRETNHRAHCLPFSQFWPSIGVLIFALSC